MPTQFTELQFSSAGDNFPYFGNAAIAAMDDQEYSLSTGQDASIMAVSHCFHYIISMFIHRM
jgi:hypothetical protein